MVAMNSGGHFVVTWDGDPNLARLDDVRARCFEPYGTPCSDEFLVNSVRTGAQQWPRVALNDANEAVFVWQSDSDDSDLATDIYIRRFDTTGQPTSGQICVNHWTWGKQRYPDVALTPDGAVVVAWEDAEPGRSDYDILATLESGLFRPDLNSDEHIDLNDLRELGRSWGRADENGTADLNRDGVIDTRDLGMLCRRWLR
jgi:hypothetical protein